MENLQEVFNRIQETGKEQRLIRQSYKDTLASNAEYVDVSEKLQALKDRKKQIENLVHEELSAQDEKLELLGKALDTDKQLLADIALSLYVKGEHVEVRGTRDEPYEPQFSVRFKKKP